MRIETKRQFVSFAMAGRLGNTPRMWPDLETFLSESTDGGAGVRMYATASPLFRPFVRREQLVGYLRDNNIRHGDYYLSEMVPTRGTVLQGELSWIGGQWVLYCSRANTDMRSALRREGVHVYGGLSVYATIRAACGESTMEWFRTLIDRYENPVIEFSVHREKYGILRDRTVIWEVRSY